MDLAFIVQDSIDAKDFRGVQSFMKAVLDALDFGRTLTWIGVITFNENAEIKLRFSDNNGKLYCIDLLIDRLVQRLHLQRLMTFTYCS